MSFRNFRVFTLLIAVAMLAFSVRLVEVAAGFSHFAGSVMAAQEQKAQEVKDAPVPDQSQLAAADVQEPAPPNEKGEEAEKPAEKPAGLTIKDDTKPDADKDDHGEAESAKDVEPAKIAVPEIDTPEWRDPNDMAGGFADVKEELLQDLSKRRQELDSREKQLQTQEALLKATKKELDQKYQELSQLRAEIEKLLEKQSEEEKARITSLVKIYEGMKPKDAARIFDTLDLDVLMAVMSKMSERKLSAILAEMNDERARTITIMLAEQKQLPSLPGAN